MTRYPRKLWVPRRALCVDPPPCITASPEARGIKLEDIFKTNVYLAGKIRKSCWRHGLVPGLRTAGWEDGPLVFSDFVYVGPFFVGCDHGCYHGPTMHGCGRDLVPPDHSQRHDIARACREAVEKSDLVFCYIESLDCPGTVAEIAWAQAAKVPVVVAFAPSVATPANNELHLVCSFAHALAFDVVEEDLPGLLDAAIKEFAR